MAQNNTSRNKEANKDFTDLVVDVRRVTKVTKGGKRFQFTAFVVSGNGSAMIGYGKGRGKDVSSAVAKATVRARKRMFKVSMRNETIPYQVKGSHGASSVFLQPAVVGTGLIAGGSVRLVARAAGISDLLAKSIGPSKPGMNLVKATLNALSKCRTLDRIAQLRGKTVKEILKGAHNV